MQRTFRRLRLEFLEHRYVLDAGPIDTSSRAAVVDAWFNRYQPALVPIANWTGSTSPCVPGTVADDYQAATLDMINFYRRMDGLTPVTFDPVLSNKAQQAALMMQAQGALSHTPGPGWACYTGNGAEAASNSNLALGASGAEAITLYMEDPGSGNGAAGHRRWVLYPNESQMGSGSTSDANALWVIGTDTPNPAPTWTGWPPKGYVPNELVYARWSLSRASAGFQAAAVTMKVGGQNIPVNVLPVQNGYGLNTLVWEPQGLSFPPGSADTTVQVTVSNIIVGGQNTSYTYDVQVIDPNTTGVNTAPTIDDIPDQVGDEDVPLDVPFTIGDAESPASSLSVQATWDNSVLIPAGSAALSGSGANRNLHIVPAPDQNGTAQVTITVNDGQLSASKSFKVTFNPVNDAPTIAGAKNQLITKGANKAVSLTIGDIDTPLDQLVLTAESADTVLVPSSGLVFSGSGASRTLTITPAANQEGTTTITLHLSDGQLQTDQSFDVLVTATSHPWQNPVNPLDVDDDPGHTVTATDSLIIINAINQFGASPLPQKGQGFVWPPYVDTDGNDAISANDALIVINDINSRPRMLIAPGSGEGEAAAADAGLMLYLSDPAQWLPGKRQPRG